MLDSCKLYLKFCFFSASIFFKYLEYQVYPIPSGCSDSFEFFIDFIYLMWFENISKYQKICFLQLHLSDDFIKLSSSYIGIIIWQASLLDMLEYHDSTIGGNEIFKFAHPIFHRFSLFKIKWQNICDKYTEVITYSNLRLESLQLTFWKLFFRFYVFAHSCCIKFSRNYLYLEFFLFQKEEGAAHQT